MTSPSPQGSRPTHGKAHRALSAFRKNEDGTTAIEFAAVATPFLMMLFGIIGLGLFFFTTFTLENAVERAGRLIRTGQVAAATMNEADFKAKICERVPSYVDCDADMKVYVQAFADTATNLAPLNCLDGDDLSAATAYDPGAADQVVLVTVCYKWRLAAILPFIDLGNMGSTGNRLIQAVATFRTEPYSDI